MELPAELRNRIYEMYFDDLRQPIYAPKQPPLTLTCSLVRKEALPLFFARCCFGIAIPTTAPIEDPEKPLRFTNDTLMWLHSTSERDLASIEHLSIMTFDTLLVEYPCEDDIYIRFRIDWDADQQTFLATGDSATDLEEYFHRIKAEVQRLLEKMSGRESSERLKKSDFFDLRKALEDAREQD